MSGVNDIRSKFLDFFAENGHEIVPSSPLVPRNDPTLMFTNAGMVQFKNVFTGVEKRGYTTATTSQKCVRAGGKHNDLDNVGYTARHLTFFEMLGNFSFGDYFKERAIELAWKLVTKEFGLKKDKLLVTVYHTDDEAFDLWKKIAGFSDDRIIRIPTSDNFWAMGDTGPCGPCSEIFIDRGEHIWGGPPGSPEEDGDRFLEFWNLVFMQFEQVTKEERQPLPRPSIDTGLGLERMACILQGVDSVFETDLFRHLIDATASALGSAPQEQNAASFRVIADHLRSSAFLIADGVLPSNMGRGYVLRRIMRRGMRHAQLLGTRDPLMWKLVPALVREMGQAYPELLGAEGRIEEVLRLEETNFRRTLGKGLGLLENAIEAFGGPVTDVASGRIAKGSESRQLPGHVAFTLYDTYGFPLDLTQDALRSKGWTVDVSGFNIEMEKQRSKARAAWTGSGEAATDGFWFSFSELHGATDFLGYATEEAEGIVYALAKDGEQVLTLEKGDAGAVLLNQTPFYAESGGQVGDTGVMVGEGVRFQVTGTQKRAGDLIVHFGNVEEGRLEPGTVLSLSVDHDRRSSIRRNHSATHLLHEALRQVLGDHIEQRGSLVAPERLRFDFAHNKPITPQELARIEDIANEVVLENDEVTTRLMAVDDAREAGARALFGEKYGDEVRVVSMGKQSREQGHNALGWSVELCGGTHVKRTGDIGLISVTGESAVSSGVRRIEALTGSQARKHANDVMMLAKTAASELRTTVDDVPARIAALMEERKKLEQDLSEARKKLALGGGGSGGKTSNIVEVNGTRFYRLHVTGLANAELRSLVDQARTEVRSGVVAVANTSPDGKANIFVSVTQDVLDRFNAPDLVRIGAPVVGGKGGGGKPEMAQAGGPDGSKASAALDAIEKALAG